MTQSNIDIAKAAYQAYADSDRAAIEKLIAEDFSFTSPLDNGLDRKTYFERCWPNNEHIAGFDFLCFVPDGDRVFAVYEGRNREGGRFRNTEILTVRNGRIVEVEVYFGWSLPHPATPGNFVDQ